MVKKKFVCSFSRGSPVLRFLKARIFKSSGPVNDLRPAIDVTLRELSKSVEFFRFGRKLKVLPKRAKTVPATWYPGPFFFFGENSAAHGSRPH